MDPGADLFVCSGCDTAAEVVWPSEETVYGIERLLLMRPDESTRNWEPGETLVDLMMENGAHGLLSSVDGKLTVTDGAILRDSLPASRHVMRAVAA